VAGETRGVQDSRDDIDQISKAGIDAVFCLFEIWALMSPAMCLALVLLCWPQVALGFQHQKNSSSSDYGLFLACLKFGR